MNTMLGKNFIGITYFEDSQKNTYIKEALKELLYEIAKNPSNYTISKGIFSKNNNIILKEISYVLVISIRDYLNFIVNGKRSLNSQVNANLSLKRFIKNTISKLKSEKNFKNNNYIDLDYKLDDLYITNEQVSTDPIIQFIYWSIKNLPRLCINPKKEILYCDAIVIFSNYINCIFGAIDEYNKISSKLTSGEIRNFLSSTFIDKILESEYYQKIFG